LHRALVVEVDDESSVDEMDFTNYFACTFDDLILLADGNTNMQIETIAKEERIDTPEDITIKDILENDKVKKYKDYGPNEITSFIALMQTMDTLLKNLPNSLVSLAALPTSCVMNETKAMELLFLLESAGKKSSKNEQEEN
jgi:hypothetical protein